MTDFSQQQNHINNPDLCSTQNFPSTKRPLLATNLNSLKNIRNNHTNNNNNTVGFTKPQQHQQIQTSAKNELSEETIRNNVQIVLNNIQRNAIKQQQQQQQMLKSAGGGMMSSPESDFNSNLYLGCGGAATMLGCSIASSHDFTHDNSDYQWFLDYG
jgi:hypothetical protein